MPIRPYNILLYFFRSGTEEIVTELDDLLQQILELMNEFKGKKGGVKTQTQDKTSFQKGFDAREDCVANMQRGIINIQTYT